MGSTSAVAVDSKGNVWVADRCGANDCAGSKLDPVMEFDKNGNFVKSFGAGKMLFPHGIFIDKDDHIWIADGHVGKGIGDDVIEFDQNGKVLKILGKPGVSGNGPDTFHEPNAVLIAPNGNIFVADGHEPGPGHNARVVKLDPNGKFIMQWGSTRHGSRPVRDAAFAGDGQPGPPVRRRPRQQSRPDLRPERQIHRRLEPVQPAQRRLYRRQ